MTETFRVGQTVRHQVRGDVEVAYGPYTNTFDATRYIIRLEDGRETHASPDVLSVIPETPKFTVGDVVTLATRAGMKATVEYGPFDDRDVYVVKLVDEPTDADDIRTFTAMGHVMTKVPEPEPVQVGDRVRVVYAEWGDEAHGKLATVESVTDGWTPRHTGELHPYKLRVDGLSGRYWARDVERVEDGNTFTHDGVIYDLTARYRDRDGDEWTFSAGGQGSDGTPNGAMNGYAGRDHSYTLGYAAQNYGPLTRV
ncbi:phiSA1p31-related protein [Streptomyces chartreusis]|uniref:phiSA1p31-related protein n=1 Tax=Streptomyces chartreusis TaxID=1969 RepID=UPI0033EC34CF